MHTDEIDDRMTLPEPPDQPLVATVYDVAMDAVAIPRTPSAIPAAVATVAIPAPSPDTFEHDAQQGPGDDERIHDVAVPTEHRDPEDRCHATIAIVMAASHAEGWRADHGQGRHPQWSRPISNPGRREPAYGPPIVRATRHHALPHTRR